MGQRRLSPRRRLDTADGTRVLAEAENSQQSLVDAPLLLWTNTADKVAQAAGVDSANLLHEDTGRLAQEVDLRTEGGSPRAVRCGRYEYYRAGQQLVCLDDHPISAALLLVTRSTRGAELVNVTPEHACSP